LQENEFHDHVVLEAPVLLIEHSVDHVWVHCRGDGSALTAELVRHYGQKAARPEHYIDELVT
jgi:hypothetical protein